MIQNYTLYDSSMIALIFFTIIIILYHFTKRKKHLGEKTSMYACGESIDPKNTDLIQNESYNTIIKSLNINILSKIHSGKLTEYLFLVCTGTLLIIIILVLTW